MACYLTTSNEVKAISDQLFCHSIGTFQWLPGILLCICYATDVCNERMCKFLGIWRKENHNISINHRIHHRFCENCLQRNLASHSHQHAELQSRQSYTSCKNHHGLFMSNLQVRTLLPTLREVVVLYTLHCLPMLLSFSLF